MISTKRSHLRTRGHKYKIYKEHATKLPRIKTFSNRIVNVWNELPAEIVEADSINSFKNKLDKHWIEKVYETPFYYALNILLHVFRVSTYRQSLHFFCNTLLLLCKSNKCLIEHLKLHFSRCFLTMSLYKRVRIS